MTCKSVPQTPQNATSIFTWFSRHKGSSTSMTATLPLPCAYLTSAFIPSSVVGRASWPAFLVAAMLLSGAGHRLLWPANADDEKRSSALPVLPRVQLNRKQLSDQQCCARVVALPARLTPDRKSTRLNSSHLGISYAVF